jgi:pheromone shutdown protein TraB
VKFKRKPEEKAKLIDRFAIAFFSAVLAFITALVIWAILVGANLGGAFIVALSFKWVLSFTLFMSVLGFLLLENFLISIYGYIWRAICYAFGIYPGNKL